MFMIYDIAILVSFVSLLYHSSIHKEPYIAMCKYIFFCYLIIYRLVVPRIFIQFYISTVKLRIRLV